jgi:hypothetical protein
MRMTRTSSPSRQDGYTAVEIVQCASEIGFDALPTRCLANFSIAIEARLAAPDPAWITSA